MTCQISSSIFLDSLTCQLRTPATNYSLAVGSSVAALAVTGPSGNLPMRTYQRVAKLPRKPTTHSHLKLYKSSSHILLPLYLLAGELLPFSVLCFNFFVGTLLSSGCLELISRSHIGHISHIMWYLRCVHLPIYYLLWARTLRGGGEFCIHMWWRLAD